MLLALRAVLATDQGQKVFKYLFKTLQVNELPAKGLDGTQLHDTLGYLRSGREVFKIAAEADTFVTTRLMVEVEKENYAELLANKDII